MTITIMITISIVVTIIMTIALDNDNDTNIIITAFNPLAGVGVVGVGWRWWRCWC